MKTAIVTMDYRPKVGGVSTYWFNLFKELSHKDFIIIAPFSSEAENEEGVERCGFFYRFFWPRWLKLFFSLIFLIKEKKIDKIIAGQVLPIGTVAYLLKKFGFLSGYYISAHGMDLAILRGRKRILAKKILKSADKVMVNSNFTADLAASLGVKRKDIFIVLPCPNKLPNSGVDIKKKYNLLSNKIILSVARLVERKGIDSVIRSLPIVWQKFPDLVYIIVGDGPFRSKLKKIIDDNIPSDRMNQIILAGRVPESKLSSFYQAADLFVLPTKNLNGDTEGFGIVNLEAGLFHLPVIASPISQVAGSVIPNKTGLIVNPDNYSEIAEKILYLLENKSYAEYLGENNYNYAKSFSWKKQAEILKKNIL